MLSTRGVVVTIRQPEHAACPLAPVGCAVVACARGHESPQQLCGALVDEARRLHQLDRLLDRLLEGSHLRLAGFRLDCVQIERHQLQLAVDAPRQHLPQPLELLRLGAVRQIAARRLVRVHVLEQPLPHLQLVDLVHDRRHLLAVRRAGRVQDEARDVRALAVDHRAGHLDLAARQLDAKEPRKDAVELRHLLARDAQREAADDREVDGGREVVARLEALLARLGNRAQSLQLCLLRGEIRLRLAGHRLQLTLELRLTRRPLRCCPLRLLLELRLQL